MGITAKVKKSSKALAPNRESHFLNNVAGHRYPDASGPDESRGSTVSGAGSIPPGQFGMTWEVWYSPWAALALGIEEG